MKLRFIAASIFTLLAYQKASAQALCFPGDPSLGVQGEKCPLVGGTDDIMVQARCWSSANGAIDPNDPKVDWLNSNAKAETRFRWAINCGYVPPHYETMFKFVRHPITDALVPRERYKYPTYAYPDVGMGYPIWRPETQAPGFPATPSSCSKPTTVKWLTNCDSGCYERSMTVLFQDGYRSIPDALGDKAVTHIMTVKDGSTMDNMEFEATKIHYFTRDLNVTEQTIVKITTVSGGTLKVTENHPLLVSDGTIREADQLAVGEKLVKASGEADAIEKIEKFTIKDRVYNVAPRTANPIENLVVAEGFLSGSQRYQDKTLQDLNRLVIRHNIPDHLIN
jgi:hypothetical protein